MQGGKLTHLLNTNACLKLDRHPAVFEAGVVYKSLENLGFKMKFNHKFFCLVSYFPSTSECYDQAKFPSYVYSIT